MYAWNPRTLSASSSECLFLLQGPPSNWPALHLSAGLRSIQPAARPPVRCL